jgi:predicted enzyme related to lactoylglutathione lyase
VHVTGFVVNLNSERPDELRSFYRDTIGLRPNPEMGEGALMAASTPFLIDSHSDLSGPAKEPPRTLFNFKVDDVRREQARLEATGVRFLGPPSDQPISFATFVDPDGNYGQIFSMDGAPPGEMFALMRHSPDPGRLRGFLRQAAGLSVDYPDIGNPFLVAGSSIYVGEHSGITGNTREPARVILNLFVDDIEAEEDRMGSAGATFIRKRGKEYWGGVISTFVDPDGSYWQLIEYHPEATAT